MTHLYGLFVVTTDVSHDFVDGSELYHRVFVLFKDAELLKERKRENHEIGIDTIEHLKESPGQLQSTLQLYEA